MKIHIQFTADLNVHEAAPAVALIEVDPCAQITIQSSELCFDPDSTSEVFTDIYGNRCRRVGTPARKITITYAAVVDVSSRCKADPSNRDPDLMQVPPDVLLYTLPSRYCPSDEFGPIANDLFGATGGGVERVQSICDWIHEHIEYRYGTSSASTSARDTVISRAGVCRDFAHFGISFCRALNIPARYVSGYCLGLEPQDLHAYFQAYLDGEWVDFDATSEAPRPALIRIAAGRDAADCAWWTSYGDAAVERMSVEVSQSQ